MASVLGGDVVASSLRAASPGKLKKVFIGLSWVVPSQSFELHEMNLQLLRFLHLNPKKVEKFISWGDFPHSMKNFFPFVQKSFNVIILEFELVQVSDVQEIKILFTFLKPLEE